MQQLLDRCDRSDPVQVRDFAILMLVARLGLRSIEVARMQLDDIDWRSRRIILHGKGSRGRRDALPMKSARRWRTIQRQRCPSTNRAALGIHFMQSASPSDQSRTGQRRNTTGL